MCVFISHMQLVYSLLIVLILIYTVTHNDILYTGMMYHERKDVCHWKTMYTVVRDLDVLIEV